MTLNCEELSVHKLFKNYSTLHIPKYQRGYSWENWQVDQFVADIDNCYSNKNRVDDLHHFFGGIVAVVSSDNYKNDDVLEIIDGQQRVTTFVLLVSRIVESIERYIDEFNSKIGIEYKNRLIKYASGLQNTYLFYSDTYGDGDENTLKLIPTANDIEVFGEVIRNGNISKIKKSRNSHKNIINACKLLDQFVRSKIVNLKKPSVIIQNLDRIRQVLEVHCRLIFIKTKNRNDAYSYFQVLNDRGIQLTTGNLLKADTLKLLEENGEENRTDRVAHLWDSILGDKRQETERIFKTIYASRTGKRPSNLRLPNLFMDEIIEVDKIKSNEKFGSRLERRINEVVNDANTIDELRKAVWVPSTYAVTKWEQERLRSLVIHLRQQMVIPLLLALTKCQPNVFYDSVTMLERVVCRYINIQKLRPGLLEEVFLKHSPKAYQRKYSKKQLRDCLAELLEDVTSDRQFGADLEEFRFQVGSQRLNAIKVFLSVLENHWDWGNDGTGSEPVYESTVRTENLDELVVEHIYPRSSTGLWQDEKLAQFVDQLGNLTIRKSNGSNNTEIDSFSEKKMILKKTNLKINRQILQNRKWTSDDVDKRLNYLINLSQRVFKP